MEEFGTVRWYLNGKLHREDGPAYELGEVKEWWVYGKRHREDGPAIVRKGGTKAWYLNDELHREDGPAVERSDGYKRWYLNGLLHRVDGPACEWGKSFQPHYCFNHEVAIESDQGFLNLFINGHFQIIYSRNQKKSRGAILFHIS
jgi:hypothetical protein